MGYALGVPYMVLWFSSILAGYAGLFCPLFPLLLISNKWYRVSTDFLMAFWQMYPAALLEFFFGCQIVISGDAIDSSETSLLVMNHRTRTDWNFLWPAVYQNTKGLARWIYPTKFILKDAIRHLPGVGWAMQLGSYIYIKREWQVDEKRLTRAIDFFADLEHHFSILIFPEGTDFTEKTKARSDRFAEINNLPKYKNVLHPRTAGFALMARKMADRDVLGAVYDVTIIYDEDENERVPQNEMALIKGEIPRVVRLHFERHEAPSIGTTEEDFKLFLEKSWSRKEQFIEDYKSNKKRIRKDFKDDDDSVFGGKKELRTSRRDLYVALVFWSVLPLPVVYLFVTCAPFRYLCVLHTAFLLALNFFSDGGFQAFEIGVHEWKKRGRFRN